MNSKLFVWDFHGVLEKDNEFAVLEVSNIILEKFGYTVRFSKEDNQKLYGVKWYEYFEYLLPEENHKKHLALQQACIDLESEKPHIVDNNIKANDHVHEVLEKIGTKYDQILISNMSDVALLRFMKVINVTQYFSDGKAFAANSYIGNKVYTKNEILEKYLKDKKFDKLIIIGDTPRDMELKKVVGGVTYLYNHPNLNFKNCKADYKINDLREILREM